MGELRGEGWASHVFCHGQKRDYLSRASSQQRARGATKNAAIEQLQVIDVKEVKQRLIKFWESNDTEYQ